MISIVIPCYNCENTLQRCMDSVFSQNHSDFEVVLVNDGSTDSTAVMCDQFAKHDQRVKVIHQDNKGLMAAWKRGVRESAGEYIAFVDSDDWIEKDLVERLHFVIAKEQPDMITYGIKTDYSDGSHLYRDNRIRNGLYQRDEIAREIFPKYFFDDGMGTMAIMCSRWIKAIKKRILISNMDLLNDSFSIGEDDITSFCVFLDAQTIYNIEKYYPYHYCRRKGSMLGSYTLETVQKFVEVKRELYHIADVKNYKYKDQIALNFGENLLIALKKVMVDMGYDLKTTRQYVRQICALQDVAEFLNDRESLRKFGMKENIMATLLRLRGYSLCIYLSRVANKVMKGPTI